MGKLRYTKQRFGDKRTAAAVNVIGLAWILLAAEKGGEDRDRRSSVAYS